MRRFLLTLCLIAALAGCQPADPPATRKPAQSPTIPATSPPLVDLSTPDRALKSYWARKDWYQQMAFEAAKEFEKTFAKLPKPSDVYGLVTTGDALAYWADLRLTDDTKLQRDIDSVKQETDSRAVALVRIKNVTPIPDGAKASPREFKEREAGVMFRYVLEKDGANWKVAEVWSNSDILGWRKFTEKRTPSFPSSVYHD